METDLTYTFPSEDGREQKCGHQASGNGFSYTCDRPAGHKDWHGETVQLRQGPSTTNWGDDGLARHASKDEARRKAAGTR